MRRTKADAEETGRVILQAAEQLFLENGYEQVSLDEIAAAAGVTRGAVHWHFKNKIGLLLELRSQTQEPFRKLGADFELSARNASARDVIQLFETMFADLESDPRQRALFRVCFHCDLTADEDDRATAFHREMRAILLAIFRSLARRKGLRQPWTPESGAATFAAVIGGLILDWVLERPDFRLAPDGSSMLALILESLVEA